MIITALERTLPSTGGIKSLFLAGGITNCPEWQFGVADQLDGENRLIFNPRRRDFPIDDPNAAQEQIKWEFDALRVADSILFWFPHETLCPIVLYELGAWNMTDKPLFVGTHPDYARKQDVIVQTKLARHDVTVRDSLEETVRDALDWLNSVAD